MDNDSRRKKNVSSKKVNNICLNSSVIISKTNHVEENLHDANRIFENSKE